MEIPEEVLQLFDNKLRIGYVATTRPDGDLAVVPVGVMIRDGKLRISSPSRTLKVRNLRADPRIAICVPDPALPTRYAMVRGTAELADDVGREFVNWMAREHMGREQYPYESSDVSRTVITVHPRKFVTPKVHGAK